MPLATLPLPLGRVEEALLRDELLDRLQTESFEALVSSTVAAIRAAADPRSPEHQPAVRNLALIHSDEELEGIVASNLRYLLVYDPGTGGGDSLLVAGAEPISWSSVVVGFAVGVTASIVAAAIYDWATDEEFTYVVEVDGVLVELTIDDDGHVVSSRVVSGGRSP